MKYETFIIKLTNNDTDLGYFDPLILEAENKSDNVYNALTPTQEYGLCDALKNNTTLKKLNLSKNKISEEGFSRLCDALKENKTLKSLEFSYYRKEPQHSYISSQDTQQFSRSMIEDLASALRANSSLQRITIRGKFDHVEKDMLGILLPFLKDNKSLFAFEFLTEGSESKIGAYGPYTDYIFKPLFDSKNHQYLELLTLLGKNAELAIKNKANQLHVQPSLSFINEGSPKPKDNTSAPAVVYRSGGGRPI